MRDLVDKIRSEWSWEDFVASLSYVLDPEDTWLVFMAQLWAFDQWHRLFVKVDKLVVEAQKHGALPDRKELEAVLDSYVHNAADIYIKNARHDLGRDL